MQSTVTPVHTTDERAPSEQARIIRAMMILRVVIVTALLGSALYVQLFFGRASDALYFIIGLTYLLTVFYAVLAGPFRSSSAFAIVQLLIDTVLVSLLVLTTGAVDSSFIILYYVLVVTAAVTLGRKPSFIIATVSGVQLAAVVILANTGLVDLSLLYPYQTPSLTTLLYITGLHLFAMELLAALSGYLAGMLQKTATRLRQRTADLMELRILHESIVRSTNAGIITADMEGLITFVNPAAEMLIKLNRSELIGKAVKTMLEDNPTAPDAIVSEESWSREMLLACNDEKIDVNVNRTLLIGRDGGYVGKLYVIQDLRELKALQEQLRLRDHLAAAGRMSAAIAHEIRNPLGAISGSAQMIGKESGLPEELRYYTDIIVREGDRVSKILNNFLSFARLPTYSPSLINLVSVVRETVALLAHSQEVMPAHTLEFRTDELEELNAFVDANMVKQLIYNLTTNSVRAMPDGGKLSIELMKDHDNSILVFKDTGVGIQEDDLDKLFQPFSSGLPGGIGLGLAIVYRIVQEHGGTILVRSLADVGTSVTVTLPLDRGEPANFSAKAIAAGP